jgi:hypothetical protein
MISTSGIQSLIRAQAERLLPHEELFARVLPEAIAAQTELFRRTVDERHAARTAHLDFLVPRARLEQPPPGAVSIEGIERIRKRFAAQSKLGAAPVIREHSPYVQALTLQPVRDMTVDDVVVVGGDRQLDIIGPPYPDTWNQQRRQQGSGTEWAHNQWAAASSHGEMGFGNLVQGGHVDSGAGVFIKFKPRIAPGFAQVRPYAPFGYEWFRTIITGGEQNNGGLAIRVWSWDDRGGDVTTEQDYFYWVWRAAGGSAPGYDGDPGASFIGVLPDANPNTANLDTGFLYGSQAPYFSVRPNRVYVAAVWCYGECTSEGGLQGVGVARLQGNIPWVVIGYQ